MKKKKKNKKLGINLVIITAAFVSALLFIGLWERPEVKMAEGRTFEIGEEVTTEVLIESINNAQLVTIEDLDTSVLGEHEKELVVKIYHLFKKSYYGTYKVRDTEKPVIEGVKDVVCVPYDSNDEVLTKDLKVVDNSKEDIKVEIKGDINYKKPGKYHITYVAKDSSGNRTEVEGAVIVEIEGSEAEYFTTSNGFLGYSKDGFTYIDGVLVVNKTYSIPSWYGNGLTAEFTENFNNMKAAAASEGVSIGVVSGFRTYNFQKELYEYWCDELGKEEADVQSARPGHSEHETGLAADLNHVSTDFENTEAYSWLIKNCYRYGFILRYTKGGSDSTGYIYEPWHYRYVGTELATILYNGGKWINMEDYFGISSVYGD